MADKETEYTYKRKISCDGGEPPYDHPLVYLEIDPNEGEIPCPYCNKKFKLVK